VFTSVRKQEQAIMDFIARHNDQKNAFVWTKTAEVILDKVTRARAAFV
jgi:phage-related protein